MKAIDVRYNSAQKNDADLEHLDDCDIKYENEDDAKYEIEANACPDMLDEWYDGRCTVNLVGDNDCHLCWKKEPNKQ